MTEFEKYQRMVSLKSDVVELESLEKIKSQIKATQSTIQKIKDRIQENKQFKQDAESIREEVWKDMQSFARRVSDLGLSPKDIKEQAELGRLLKELVDISKNL